MDVDALIDAYIQDVVRLIPRKQRQDVTLELRGMYFSIPSVLKIASLSREAALTSSDQI